MSASPDTLVRLRALEDQVREVTGVLNSLFRNCWWHGGADPDGESVVRFMEENPELQAITFYIPGPGGRARLLEEWTEGALVGGERAFRRVQRAAEEADARGRRRPSSSSRPMARTRRRSRPCAASRGRGPSSWGGPGS
eukprot:tig00000681_g3126.t1